TIQFTITGANPTSGSAATNSQGVAVFTYTGAQYGVDTAQASIQVGNVQLLSNTATITWLTFTLSPTVAGPNVVRSTQSLTATLLDASGVPLSGYTVQFAVTGPNAQTGSATTDSQGNAVFTYTGTQAGLDTAQASVQVSSTPLASNTATITWLTFTLSPTL